jgi:hypothetical protein
MLLVPGIPHAIARRTIPASRYAARRSNMLEIGGTLKFNRKE